MEAPATDSLAQLSDFKDLVGEIFVLSMDGVEQTVEGELIKAEAINPSGDPNAKREPFTLEFKLPPNANIGQGTFNLTTEKAEVLPPMFLIPRNADDDGWYMDTVFN